MAIDDSKFRPTEQFTKPQSWQEPSWQDPFRQEPSWQEPSWDDLKAFVAVAVHGSMNKAGAALGESQATVGRRMQRLESVLGVPLFERGVNTTQLLRAGHDLLRAASPMTEAVRDIDAAIAPYRPRLDVPLRLTATNTMSLFLTNHFQHLRAVISPRELVILPTRRQLDINRGETDIALRMRTVPLGDDILVRKVGTVMFAVYGLANNAQLPIIMVSSDRAVAKHHACATAILAFRAPGPQIDELHLRIQAIKSGVGVGLLPCWFGDSDSDLVRVHDDLFGMVYDDLFLVRTVRSKSDPEISALAQALVVLLRKNRNMLSGKRP